MPKETSSGLSHMPQDRNTTVGKKACGLIQSKYLSTNKYGKRAIEMENSWKKYSKLIK